MKTGNGLWGAGMGWLIATVMFGLSLTGCSDESARGSARAIFGGSPRSLFSKAEAAAEAGNINFFGFYTGMSEDDLVALAHHYGFENIEEKELFYTDNVETHEVYSFRITLEGVRRITKAGNTFEKLAQAVANQVGILQGDGVTYSYKTIDGVTLKMDEEQGCTIYDAPRALNGELAVQRQKKAEFARQVAEIPVINKQLRGGAIHQAGETKVLTLPGGAKMEMAWCPPGAFLMGNAEDERDFDETPHRVTLTKGFWMAKTEVTQVQWMSVMGSNPSCIVGDELPVDMVSWNDCLTFCRKTGLQLPTEAQWEYACRAGTTGPCAGSGNMDEMGWYNRNTTGWGPHPVRQQKPNAWGLYDMHGNVEEWCSDWYGDYSEGSVTNSNGSSSGSDRVVRGGCWVLNADFCSSFRRGAYGPSDSRDIIGFRPVRNSE